MLRNLLISRSGRLFQSLCQLSTKVNSEITTGSPTVIDTRFVPNEDTIHSKGTEDSVLEPCKEDISHDGPYLRPSFNFAAYVNNSETLQNFVKLGIELYKWESQPDLPEFILRLDFENDIKKYIIFFTDLGLQTEDLGNLIQKNPYILKEDLDNLEVRINYLRYKKFDNEMIVRILQKSPKWLSLSTQEIDARLGHFQQTFGLTGNEVRQLATKRPQLITYNLKKVKLNTFVLKEEMGFDPGEIKSIILQTPKLLTKNQASILNTFEYIHKEMNIPLETIAKMPEVLTMRKVKIKERYQFLKKINKIQFDPKKPNYIALTALVFGTDTQFATEVAGSSIHTYNAFLKTL